MFSQSSLTSVTLRRDGPDLVVAWTSSAAAGTPFQVYVDGARAWSGAARTVRLPAPTRAADIEVGAVAAGEERIDFHASLPALSADRARLAWTGGSSVAATVASFRVYSSAAPGGPVDATHVLATLPARTSGAVAPSYAWTSPPLASGVWQFQVVPVDVAGNPCASPGTVSVTIAAPPKPPAADARGARLHYAFAPATRVATLTWLPSPA